jgi:centromere protein J
MKRQYEELTTRNQELNDELKVYSKYRNNDVQDTKVQRNNFVSNKYDHEKDEEEEEEYQEEEKPEEDEEYQEEEEKQENHDDEVIQEEDEEEEEDEDQDEDGITYEDIIRKSGSKSQPQQVSHSRINQSNEYNKNRGGSISIQNKGDGMTLSTLGERLPAGGKYKGAKEYETPRGFGQAKTSIPNVAQNKTDNRFSRTYNIDDYNYDANEFFKRYAKSSNQHSKLIEQNVSQDGKIQRTYANGKKEVQFHNGVKRESFPDGYTIVNFTNNDIKQTLPDGTVIYYFAEAQTCQTTLPTGQHIYKFATNQIEFHNIDGTKEI